MSESREDLRRRLAAGALRADYPPLRYEFSQKDPDVVFHTLFPIAAEYNGDGADYVAGLLLVDLEPACPVSCREALLMVAFGDWQLSDRLVPFYLVTQFGKWKVLREAGELLATAGLSGSQATYVRGIAYFLGFPAVTLVESFVEWQRA